jgi:hypothetical protein
MSASLQKLTSTYPHSSMKRLFQARYPEDIAVAQHAGDDFS